MRLSTKFYCVVLVIFGGVLFLSVLQNGFVIDDHYQVVENALVHDIQNIPKFFLKTFEYSNTDLTKFYYRPMFYSAYAVLYFIGSGSAVVFHLLQLVLYTANVILIFLFLKSFFSKPIAFLLAMLFLVHPANGEIVAYIADLQDCLFFFFGMLAIILLGSKKKSFLRNICVFFLLLFSLFSKETGFLFVVVSGLYVAFFQRTCFWQVLKQLFIVSAVYVLARSYASGIFFLQLIFSSNSAEVNTTKLSLMVRTIFFQIKHIFLPPPNLRLEVIEGFPVTIALGVVVVLVFLFFILGSYIKKFRADLFLTYVFFLCWFVLGLIFHSHFILLDVAFANRWLYFSLVGVFGLIGVGYVVFKYYIHRWVVFFAGLYCLYLLWFVGMSVKMNIYWHNLSAQLR